MTITSHLAKQHHIPSPSRSQQSPASGQVMRTPKPSTPAAIAAAKAKEAKAAAAPSDELLEKYRSLYARTRQLEHGQMKDDDDAINR